MSEIATRLRDYSGVSVQIPDQPALKISAVSAEFDRLKGIEWDYDKMIQDMESRDLEGFKLYDGNLKMLHDGAILIGSGTLGGKGGTFKGCMVSIHSVRTDGIEWVKTAYLHSSDANGIPTLTKVEKLFKNARFLRDGLN